MKRKGGREIKRETISDVERERKLNIKVRLKFPTGGADIRTRMSP